MKPFSAKNKIIVIGLVWLVLSLLSFTYFFKFLDSSNSGILTGMAKQKKDLGVLQAEQQSETQAQRDLEELAKKSIQPIDFFSQDKTLVNEIKVLENLREKYNVKMLFSGVSGTVKSAPLAKTTTPLVTIPYSLNINGRLPDVVDFVEALENLSFITSVSNVTLGAAEKGSVNLSLTANFYLRK